MYKYPLIFVAVLSKILINQLWMWQCLENMLEKISEIYPSSSLLVGKGIIHRRALYTWENSEYSKFDKAAWNRRG